MKHLFCVLLTFLLPIEDAKWAEEISSRIDPEAVIWVKEQIRKDTTIEKMKGELQASFQPTRPRSTGVNSSLADTASYNVAVCVSFSVNSGLKMTHPNGLKVTRG